MSHQFLVLDVDGVIIEGFPRYRWDETLEKDLGIKPETMQKAFFDPHWQDIMRGHLPVEEPLADFLATHYPATSVAELLDYWHGADAHVRVDVIDAALAWQGRTSGQLALATNQDITRATYLTEALGFDQHFQTIIVSCNIGVAKPEAEYFQQADLLLGRATDDNVMFLDDLKKNVVAAKAHGWDAAQITDINSAARMIHQL